LDTNSSRKTDTSSVYRLQGYVAPNKTPEKNSFKHRVLSIDEGRQSPKSMRKMSERKKYLNVDSLKGIEGDG
jgi:hypothetical protein